MATRDRLLMHREKLATLLFDYFSAQEDVSVAYLYGSIARGEELTASDVDLGVLFGTSASEEDQIFRRVGIAQDLEELTGRRVDVTDLTKTPPHFNHQVLLHGMVLKGRSEPMRIHFEQTTRRLHFDLLPYRKRYLDASLSRLREGGREGGTGGTDPGALESVGRVLVRPRGRKRHRSD